MEERTTSGNPIYRHEQAAPSDGALRQADAGRIEAHIDTAHDGQRFVWHEILSDRVHLDVHVSAPTNQHPYYLLVTSGMSARPMNVPPGMEERDRWLFAELCMLLPPNWTPSQEAFRDERVYWPVRLLKSLARLPHEYGSWLGWGHSIPNGDPATPYAPDTPLTGCVLVPPFLFGEKLFRVPGEPALNIFQVLPLTTPEMGLKIERGLDAVLERLEEALEDPYGPVDPLRRSAV